MDEGFCNPPTSSFLSLHKQNEMNYKKITVVLSLVILIILMIVGVWCIYTISYNHGYEDGRVDGQYLLVQSQISNNILFYLNESKSVNSISFRDLCNLIEVK